MKTAPSNAAVDAEKHQGTGLLPKTKGSGGQVSEGSRVGRPSGCTPEVVGLLRGVIRELGLSDSAAARQLGIGVSSLSRWKREDPEVRLLLQQAREECRAVQLQNIMKSAAAEHGRGWRAAAWLLERLFPEDYSPHAGAREGHRSVAEARERREEEAAEAEARVQRAWAAAAEAARDVEEVAQGFQTVGGSGGCSEPEPGGARRPADTVSTQEGDCRNCRNSEGDVASDAKASGWEEAGSAKSSAGSQPDAVQLRPQGHDQVQLRHENECWDVLPHGQVHLPDAAFTQDVDCRNCRNSVPEASSAGLCSVSAKPESATSATA